MKEQLGGQLSRPKYELLVRPLGIRGIDADGLHLTISNEVLKGWLLDQYADLLNELASLILGRPTRVTVSVATPAAVSQAASYPTDSNPMLVDAEHEFGSDRGSGMQLERRAPVEETRVRRPLLNPRFTFDSFVVGSNNTFCYSSCLQVAQNPGQSYNPLFIYGGVGLGKTHLLHAVGNFINETTPELRTMYVSVETFTNQFINALRDGNMHSFKDRYRSVDVLLIDDIQSLAGREQTQEEFFHTFNALHDGGKQIIISSDRPPKEIATLEDRLRSRFEMGLITDIQPPDVETRIAILRKRAAAEGIHIAHPEVLSVIAERVSSNVRALEGALNRVIAHAALDGRPVSVELANDVLRNLYPADQGAITVEHVQREVCRYFGISHDELVGQKRTRRLVTPRQVAMFLTRDLTDSSLPAIGRAFGGRDHSTVLYAVQKITDQIKDEGEIYTAVTDLTTRLTGNS